MMGKICLASDSTMFKYSIINRWSTILYWGDMLMYMSERCAPGGKYNTSPNDSGRKAIRYSLKYYVNILLTMQYWLYESKAQGEKPFKYCTISPKPMLQYWGGHVGVCVRTPCFVRTIIVSGRHVSSGLTSHLRTYIRCGPPPSTVNSLINH